MIFTPSIKSIQSLARAVMRHVVMIAMVMGSVLSPALAQQEVPSNLQVVGTITAANSVTPAVNDLVLVVQPTSLGRTEAQGTVLAGDGTFFVDMSKTQSYNGRALTLLLKKGNVVYQLNNGSTPLTFPYSGTFPFPSRINFTLAIGTRLSGGDSGSGSGSGSGGTKNDAFDVNADGVFNQSDVDAIKSSLGAPRPSAKMDVNSDGIVNTRDAIDAIRALNESSLLTPVPASSTTTTTTTQ
jgi:hypothetical protein